MENCRKCDNIIGYGDVEFFINDTSIKFCWECFQKIFNIDKYFHGITLCAKCGLEQSIHHKHFCIKEINGPIRLELCDLCFENNRKNFVAELI